MDPNEKREDVEVPADSATTESSDVAAGGPTETVSAETVGCSTPPLEGAEADTLREQIVERIRTVYDPEIPVNIYELGMIYDIHISADKSVEIRMTLTSPACPVAGTLPGEVEAKVRDVEGLDNVRVELVWDPPWTPALMSEAARLMLNM